MADPNDALLGHFWRGRRVLVTGGAGFVGANLLAELLDRGALPTSYDQVLTSPSLQALGVDCASVLGDVLDLAELRHVVADVRPGVLFHLAGQAHIKDAQEAPFAAFQVNALGTVTVLEAVRREAPGAAVVVASSNEVYPASGPWREDHRPEPRTLYGWSKLCQDEAARAYGQVLGLKVACLRHANAVGPANPHTSHLTQTVIAAILGGEKVVRLRSDGTPRKAYLWVGDVCNAYLRLAEALSASVIPSGQPWNAGSNETPSARDVAERLIALSHLDIALECSPATERGPDQAHYWQGLDSRALASLGWQPRPLKEALANTFAWYKAHGLEWLEP